MQTKEERNLYKRLWVKKHKKHVTMLARKRLKDPIKLERYRETQRNWRRKHKDVARAQYFKKFYNITLEQYAEMAKNNNNKCSICGLETKLYVDHSHITGKVRGLLCHKCNTGLGFFNDSIDNLKKAADYIYRSF
jgi:hypothetical protein